MNLTQAINLIHQKKTLFQNTRQWVDLGCGTGLFTQALAQLLPEGSVIHAVDTNKNALLKLPKLNHCQIVPHALDFEREAWPFHSLDGVLMANALHYVVDKRPFIKKTQQYLHPSHLLLIIEYERNKPNPWVPYPITYAGLSSLLLEEGYREVGKLGERPSIFGRTPMYAALAQK